MSRGSASQKVDWSVQPLGRYSDYEMGARLGVSPATARDARQRRYCPAAQGKPGYRSKKVASLETLSRRRANRAIASGRAPACLICGSEPSEWCSSSFYDAFEHRCKHGEPCHAGQPTESTVCKLCPPPRKAVSA